MSNYKNVEKRRETTKLYRAKNKVKLDLQRKQWDIKYNSKESTKIKRREVMITYYHAHKEPWLSRVIRWQTENPDKFRIIRQVNAHKRRLRIKSGTLTTKEWKEIKTLYCNTCPCCGKIEPEIKLTIDHVIPLSVGGLHEKGNIQPLCGKCNLRKFTKTIRFELIAGEKLI